MTQQQFREDLNTYQRRAFRAIARYGATLLPQHRAKAGSAVIGDQTLCVLINNGLIELKGKRFALTADGRRLGD